MIRSWAAAIALAGCYQPLTIPPDAPVAGLGGASGVGAPPVGDRPDEGPLACEAAVERALARHPVLLAASAGLPVRRAEVDAAGALDPPEIRLRAAARDPSNDHRIGLRVPLGVPGAAGAHAAAAEAETRLTAAEVAEVRVELAAEMRLAIAGRDLALAMRDARRQKLAVAGDRLAEAMALAAAGTATALAEREADVERVLARAAAAAAEAEVRATEVAVSRLLGGPVAPGPCAPAPEGPVDLDLHPAVQQAREAASAAHATAFAERRAGWMWPRFLELGWDSDPSDPGGRLLLETGIPLPWWSPAAEVAEAEARHHLEEVRSARDTVARGIDVAREAHAGAVVVLRQLEAAAPEIEAAVALAERAARSHASRDLLGLTARLADYAAELAEARYRVAVTAAELRLARGEP